MEKRLLLAAGLSLAVLLAWEWLAPKPPKAPVAVPPTPVSTSGPAMPAAAAGSAASPQTPPAAAMSAAAALPAARERVRRDHGDDRQRALHRHVLQPRGRADLLRPGEVPGREEPPARSRARLPPELPRPLSLDFGRDAAATKAVSNALFVVEKESDRVLRMRYADATIAVEKEIKVGAGYLFDVKVNVAGPAYDLLLGPGLRNPPEDEKKSRYVMPASAVVASADGLEARPPREGEGGGELDAAGEGIRGHRGQLLPRGADPVDGRDGAALHLCRAACRRQARPGARDRHFRHRGPSPRRRTSAPRRSRRSTATASVSSARSTSGGTGSSRGRCCG